LRGDPTPTRPNGVKLPVDAYYPSRKLVLEFREGQHYGDRFAFRDGRITATGESRKEQRQKYDKKRDDFLPANGIKLLVVYDYQLTGKSENDFEFIKDALNQLLLARQMLSMIIPKGKIHSQRLIGYNSNICTNLSPILLL
jgi:hypothetical protein